MLKACTARLQWIRCPGSDLSRYPTHGDVATNLFLLSATAFTVADNWTKTEPERYIFSIAAVRPLHHQSYNTIKGVA